MKQRIVFLSGAMGKQGKSTQSITFSQYSKLPFFTNDKNNSTYEIYNGVKGMQINTIKPNESLEKLDKENGWIFDAGGFEEVRVKDVIQKANKIVVVFYYQSIADFIEFRKGIKRLQNIKETDDSFILQNKEVFILLNNTIKESINDIKEEIAEEFPEYSNNIYAINHSKYFWRLSSDLMTVFDIASKGGLEASNLLKRTDVMNQLQTFYNVLLK